MGPRQYGSFFYLMKEAEPVSETFSISNAKYNVRTRAVTNPNGIALRNVT
jgi:hypothetical protein